MLLLRFYSFLLLLSACNAINDIVPTFLLDYEGAMRHVDYEPNPFSKISSQSFEDILNSAIKRSEGIVVFVENSLSVEDIAVKDRTGTPYFHLRQGLLENKVKYFPNVINPYRILNRILQQRYFNVFYLNLGTKLQLNEDFKYIYVFFEDDVNENRVQVLRKHDMIIREVYFAIRRLKRGPVIAFYTGRTNPVVVEKPYVTIKPTVDPNELNVVVLSDGAIFKFSGVVAATATRRAQYNQMPMIAEETWFKWKLFTRMAYTDFELQFNFDLEDIVSWTLESVSLLEGGEEVGRTVMYASAPWDWSFVCREPIVLINARDGSSVTIPKYQIQPFRPYFLRNGTGGNGTGGCFGPSVNCSPYFNTTVLSGLLVSAVFLGILGSGLTLLFNCASNNKFDDPTGRPLMLAS